jgi:DNA polymerase V
MMFPMSKPSILDPAEIVTLLGRADEFPELAIPLYQDSVPAGFPSPAQDYVERTLDLNELLIKQPAATYFVRAQGDSMVEVGINPGDILIVDRSLEAHHGDIVIAAIDGELTVKRLETQPAVRLVPMNTAYQPIDIPEGSDLELFGVVTNVIHSLRQP